MQKIDFIKAELVTGRQWIDNVIRNLDESLWNVTPETMNTNVNWQIGHLIVGRYLANIGFVAGMDTPVETQFPLPEYMKHYAHTDPTVNFEERPGKATLLSDLDIMEAAAGKVLDGMTDANLAEPAAAENPISKDKGGIITWSVHHQFWHAGQLAMLRRVVAGKSIFED